MIEYYLADVAQRALPLIVQSPGEIDKLRILQLAGHVGVDFSVGTQGEVAVVHTLTPLGAKVIKCFACGRRSPDAGSSNPFALLDD
jgi:hypothetical protein